MFTLIQSILASGYTLVSGSQPWLSTYKLINRHIAAAQPTLQRIPNNEQNIHLTWLRM